MAAEVKNNLDEIIDACKRMQVKSLYLVGSGARKEGYTSFSDLDFLIRFNNGNDGIPIGSYDYFDVDFRLEEITGKKESAINIFERVFWKTR